MSPKFLQEAIRWRDTWLKGEATGIMKGPMLRAWMQESVPPTTDCDYRPGRWVAETAWPGKNTSPLSAGLYAGKWCSYAPPPDLPHDQRDDDGGALVFDSDPLEEDMEILDPPVAELEISAR